MTQQAVLGARDVNLIRGVFFLQPIALGAWFPRIAEIQQRLQVSEGEFALALVGMPVGLLFMLMFAGRLTEKFGARQLLIAGLFAFICLMPLPTYAESILQLFVYLAVVGSALAFVELCMNVIADKTERKSGQLIMSGCHGLWSLGVLVGSLISSGFSWVGYGPSESILMASGMALLPALFTSYSLTEGREPDIAEKSESGFQMPSGALIAVCFFAFGITMTEGAIADWSAIYVTDLFDLSAGYAGIAYSAFALMVTFGRLTGDWLRSRVDVQIAAAGIVILALIGVGILVISPNYAVSLLGFGLVGLGVSGGFPLAVTAAAEKPGRSAAVNVGLMTQIALGGFLVGPLVIGYAADHLGIQGGFMLMLPALVLSLLMSRSLIKR
ncbi:MULTISPECIES: MFS transporter [unclassified Pseudovibrio]|uniref:MFS transporter n=1 Tax=unclassified Pseudovibrio TaxID=2627060 RepID=UPI0007AE52B2|nr:MULTISPECIES: MFS transporter [unclassified Pseudovibrio]KZL07820.1 Inner membrane protein YbjJ [Pseudovibrio sp. Ad26]KZL23515.1 Inner membrane protein YbjJ [Pseudovibrio sp. WM33]